MIFFFEKNVLSVSWGWIDIYNVIEGWVDIEKDVTTYLGSSNLNLNMNDYGSSTSRGRPILKSPNPHLNEDSKTLKKKYEQAREALKV